MTMRVTGIDIATVLYPSVLNEERYCHCALKKKIKKAVWKDIEEGIFIKTAAESGICLLWVIW